MEKEKGVDPSPYQSIDTAANGVRADQLEESQTNAASHCTACRVKLLTLIQNKISTGNTEEPHVFPPKCVCPQELMQKLANSATAQFEIIIRSDYA